MEGGEATEGRRVRVAVVILVLAAALSLPWSVQSHWDPRPDAARYILAARSLLRGEGYGYWGIPLTLHPPGFSVLLAPLLGWRGLDFATLNLFVSLTGILACVLFFLHLSPRAGAPVAGAAAAALWVNPLFQRLCNQVMSDVPGLALALAALLVMRWSRDPSRASPGDWIAALLVAAAVYVRVANLALVPALAVDRLARMGERRAPAGLAFAARRVVGSVALVIALFLPWVLHASHASRRVPGVSTAVDSYWTAFLRSDAMDPDSPTLGATGWLERARSNARTGAGLLGTDLISEEPSRIAWIVAALATLGWLYSALRRRGAADAFTAAMIVILLGYYTSAPRLFLPVFALIWGGALDSARWLARSWVPPRLLDVLLVAGALGWAVVHFRADFMTPGSRTRYQELLQVCRHLQEVASAEEALAGDVGVVYGVLLDRPVYSLRAIMRDGGLSAAHDVIERYRVGHLVLERDGPCAPLLREAQDRGAEIRSFGRYAVVRWSQPAAGVTAEPGVR